MQLLLNASLCAQCTVRPNKPKASLELRKVYFKALQEDKWLRTPKSWTPQRVGGVLEPTSVWSQNLDLSYYLWLSVRCKTPHLPSPCNLRSTSNVAFHVYSLQQSYKWFKESVESVLSRFIIFHQRRKLIYRVMYSQNKQNWCYWVQAYAAHLMTGP